MRIALLVSVALLGPASAVAQEELPLMSELLAQSVESHERLLEILRARPTEDMTEEQEAAHEAHIAQTEERLERYRHDQRVALGAENAMRWRAEGATRPAADDREARRGVILARLEGLPEEGAEVDRVRAILEQELVSLE